MSLKRFHEFSCFRKWMNLRKNWSVDEDVTDALFLLLII